MKFVSKKLINEFIDDNLRQNTSFKSLITDADLPDLFASKYDVLAFLGGSTGFYNNTYVYEEFWNILISTHEMICDCLFKKGLSNEIICVLEVPLIARSSDAHDLSFIGTSIWSKLDRFINWPRYLFYNRPLVFGEHVKNKVDLLHESLPSEKYDAFHGSWKDTFTNYSMADITEIIQSNTINNEVKLATLYDAVGYKSRLLLVPRN